MGSQRWRQVHRKRQLAFEVDESLFETLDLASKSWKVKKADILAEALAVALDPRIKKAPAPARVAFVAWKVHRKVEMLSHLQGLDRQLIEAEDRIHAYETNGRYRGRKIHDETIRRAYLKGQESILELRDEIRRICEEIADA